MLDGGPGAEPAGPLAAWLVSDERSELRRKLRAMAAAHGVQRLGAAAALAAAALGPLLA